MRNETDELFELILNPGPHPKGHLTGVTLWFVAVTTCDRDLVVSWVSRHMSLIEEFYGPGYRGLLYSTSHILSPRS